jgi:hypothetical protein
MSDAEIRERLKFTPAWFALGVADEAWLERAVLEFRQSGDDNDEHYRYGAFVAYFRRRGTPSWPANAARCSTSPPTTRTPRWARR